MSFLDRAPNVVEVQLRELHKVGHGQMEMVDVGDRIEVRCSWQGVREWSTEEERTESGLQIVANVRLYARTWPGDVNSGVFFEGVEYECVGDPVHQQMSSLTRHWAVTLRKVSR